MLRAYVLNLVDRPDRWLSASSQVAKIDFEMKRIEAISPLSQSFTSSDYLANGVTAIWLSHLKAMKAFLDTGDRYALILEDDFLIRNDFNSNIIAVMDKSRLDFLQLGFLKIGVKDNFLILYENMFAGFLKILFKMRTLLPPFFSEKFFVQRQQGIPMSIIMDAVQPGAHAYVISRHFAISILELNNPPFLSTDLFFISLSQMRSFRMARVRKSKIEQSNSESSIETRFLVN
jgi:GR25 family glycosyltransferase involved in LPS biosynthesis